MAQGLPVERLRAFLRDLNPKTQSLLMTELERNALQGAEMPGTALILEELRPVVGRAVAPPVRIGNPSRLFFHPLEPFLVDRGAARVLAGRVERSSLDPLWDWICQSLLPEQAKTYCDRIVGGLLEEDDATVREATRSLQDAAAQEISVALARASADDRAARRLAAQIRTERALEEAQTLRVVLSNQDALAYIAARLPAQVRAFGDDKADNAISLFRQSLAGRSEAVPAALILLATRLDSPRQIIRLAIRSAESDAAAKVALSPFARAVEMVLEEIRGAIAELRGLCRRGHFAAALSPLKEIHDAIRAVRTELNLSEDSAWTRELAAIRSAVSDLLTGEIDSTPGWVRRLLRPRGAKETTAGFDDSEVTEIEDRIALIAACRNYAGELAVNEVAPRVLAELQTYVETGTPALIESLRGAEGADRRIRQTQVEAAVRFSAKLFGPEYAAVLTKSAAMALEHKPARA